MAPRREGEVLQRTDVLILGAGAAGLMCAMTAARRGRKVMVLDHARQAGEKILISGGGRCNFTNLHCAPERFYSANPHFCRSALARYTPADFISLVAKHGIAWHEKTLGQLFCDGPARAIVAMLLAECAAAGATIHLPVQIAELSRADRFRAETSAGAIEAESLVLATGGLSIRKLGATGLSYRIAERFGLSLVEPRPGLVPLTLPADTLARTRPLAGLSLPVLASSGKARFAEAMLFTHRGLSGPSILQLSSAWREAEEIDIDLVPQEEPGFLRARKRARPRAGLKGVLAEILPQRLAEALLPEGLAGGPIADLPDRSLAALEAELKSWRVHPSGTEGYAKAEVTLGGIDTAMLSQRKLEARAVPGLFAIGEAVDVTGWLGGYNFQWAWASGFCAGEAA
jgi:predicted Rossmann fold flavoprotein